MRLSMPIVIILTAAALATGGCSPLSPYDSGRRSLELGRTALIQGDAALNAGRLAAALADYDKATGQCDQSANHFEQAESQIVEDIRAKDEQIQRSGASRTPSDLVPITIGARTFRVDRYYVDSLHAFRGSLALAMAMKAVAVARLGESHYRSGAEQSKAGDQLYRARQYASAESAFQKAQDHFRQAAEAWGEAGEIVNSYMLRARQLTASAPGETWATMKQVQVVVDQRRSQTDSYQAALRQRESMAAQIVNLISQRKRGNLPPLNPAPLPPMPDLLRFGASHPPVPSLR